MPGAVGWPLETPVPRAGCSGADEQPQSNKTTDKASATRTWRHVGRGRFRFGGTTNLKRPRPTWRQVRVALALSVVLLLCGCSSAPLQPALGTGVSSGQPTAPGITELVSTHSTRTVTGGFDYDVALNGQTEDYTTSKPDAFLAVPENATGSV